MNGGHFFSTLADRATSRSDRAVLICAFNKLIDKKDPCELTDIVHGFKLAHVVEPRPAMVASFLKSDPRVQVKGRTCRSLREGDKYFFSLFPEFLKAEDVVQINPDLHQRLSRVPYVDDDYISDLKPMIELYANLHVLENSMRRFIEEKLRRRFGDDWWNSASNGPMRRKHEDRLAKEKARKWLPARSGLGPLYSLDWADLISLMRKHEQLFEELGSINFLHRYEDLGSLRNVVAHHGFIEDSDEFDRVKLALRDWSKQISS